jgi:hypothetical protein
LRVPARRCADGRERGLEFPKVIVFQPQPAVPPLDSGSGNAKLVGQASRLNARHVLVHACGKAMEAKRPEFVDGSKAFEPAARTNQR